MMLKKKILLSVKEAQNAIETSKNIRQKVLKVSQPDSNRAMADRVQRKSALQWLACTSPKVILSSLKKKMSTGN